MTTTEEASARPTKVRVKTPTVLQMEATECGAASLGMVLAHYGLQVRLEELRAACGISRDGSNAGNIVKAARGYGLQAKAYRKEPEDLAELGLPQILFWEFNHFVVLEGVSPGEFHLNDPASGRRRVTDEEFDGSFTGVTITFEPSEEFEPGGEVPSITDRLGPRLGRAKGSLAFAVLAGLGLVVPSLVVPLFTKLFVDEVLVAQRTSALGGILGTLLVAIVLIGGLTYVQQAALARLRVKLSLRLAGEFLWHVLRLPVAFYSSRSTADISWRVALNDRVADLLSGQFATNLLSALTILFYFVVMFFFDWVLALVALGLASLNVAALVVVTESRKNLNQRLSREQAMVQATSASGIARS